MASLQSRIQMFSKPDINVEEERKLQAKKAKFLSKLSKFENLNVNKQEEKMSKAEVMKKTKLFEPGQTDEVDAKEKELRKMSFDLIKQQFENEETCQESDSSGFGSIEDISKTASESSPASTPQPPAADQPSSLQEPSADSNEDVQEDDLSETTKSLSLQEST